MYSVGYSAITSFPHYKTEAEEKKKKKKYKLKINKNKKEIDKICTILKRSVEIM